MKAQFHTFLNSLPDGRGQLRAPCKEPLVVPTEGKSTWATGSVRTLRRGEKSPVGGPACSQVTIMTTLSLLLLLYTHTPEVFLELTGLVRVPMKSIRSFSDKLQIQTYSTICQSSQLGTTAENRLQIMLRSIQISCLSLATGNCYFPIVFLSKTVQKLCMHLTY